MALTHRSYTEIPGITPDYFAVRTFFVEMGYREFTYARWDWMVTHGSLDAKALPRIGLWEDGGRIVALATFDTRLGDGYCLVKPGYESIRPEVITLAAEHLKGDNGRFHLVVPDRDPGYQRDAESLGFVATPEREHDAAYYPLDRAPEYTLPEGFSITDMSERCDLYEYGRVLWKGFNHELKGEGAFAPTDDDLRRYDAEMHRPNVDLALKVAVTAPDGHFASYCGMWYDPAAGYAVVEPVATDPAYRRLGLGRAAVLEGVRRAAERGARLSLVGSDQQFYYSIGFRPYASASKWVPGDRHR